MRSLGWRPSVGISRRPARRGASIARPTSSTLRASGRDVGGGAGRSRRDARERGVATDSPADEADVVGGARLDDDALAMLVEPERQRAVVSAVDQLQAEHVDAEALPRIQIGDFEA